MTQNYEQYDHEISIKGRVFGPVIGTMEKGFITVDQKVEKVSGALIGAYFVELKGGKLYLRMNADLVDRTMHDSVIGTVGGTSKEELGQTEVISLLEDLLRMDIPETKNRPDKQAILGMGNKPSDTLSFDEKQQELTSVNNNTCHICHNPVIADWKFCPQYKTSLPGNLKYCINCGNVVSPSDKFCANCGKRAE